MTPSADSDPFLSEINDPDQDPLGFFPSEHERTTANRSGIAVQSVLRRLAPLKTAPQTLLRFAAGAYRAAQARVSFLSRVSAWRFPAERLPGWRLPTALSALRRSEWPFRVWHFPEWRHAGLPARLAAGGREVRTAARQIAARASISTIAASAFACGIVVGGSAVWLSGASRHVSAGTTALPQTPRDSTQTAVLPTNPSRTVLAVEARTARPGTSGTNRSSSSRPPLFRGSLIVNSRPTGARVFLNGRSVGTTPLVLRNQAAGSRAVRVALDGYESWSSAVQVVANTETRLRAELKLERPAPQP